MFEILSLDQGKKKGHAMEKLECPMCESKKKKVIPRCHSGVCFMQTHGFDHGVAQRADARVYTSGFGSPAFRKGL